MQKPMERLTDKSRMVLALAHKDAVRFGHDCIRTELILLELLKDEHCIAHRVLTNLRIDCIAVTKQVEKLIQVRSKPTGIVKLPLDTIVLNAMEFAFVEARNLNYKQIGTEVLLLGLIREQEGVAGQVLRNFGLTLEQVRQEVEKVVDNLGKDANR